MSFRRISRGNRVGSCVGLQNQIRWVRIPPTTPKGIEMINDNVIYIDVDETLILRPDDNSSIQTPNLKLIKKIKEWKEQGRSIIVWTSNAEGVEHAYWAVKFCEIEDLVDLILPKPHVIVDDDHLEHYSIIDPITLEYAS